MEDKKQIRTTSNDDHWLELISQCRASGLTDRQWCIGNGISASTFYYHVRDLQKKPVRFRKRQMPHYRNRKWSGSRFGKWNHPLRKLFSHPRRRSAWKCRGSVLKTMNRPERM
ncbi:MAG: IS66 family insertion sequence element accessory protein TnpA [Lachnospiraceae bacterium]